MNIGHIKTGSQIVYNDCEVGSCIVVSNACNYGVTQRFHADLTFSEISRIFVENNQIFQEIISRKQPEIPGNN